MNRFSEFKREMKRIIKHVLAPKHIRIVWRMYSPIGYNGQPAEKPIYDTNRHLVAWRSRDSLDQIFDFIADHIGTYRRCIKEAQCTHPHGKCYVEIEGDQEYGFCKQYLCSQCDGYIGPDMVMDRYDGGTLIAKDHLKPDFIPRGYRPEPGDLGHGRVSEDDDMAFDAWYNPPPSDPQFKKDYGLDQ